MKKLIVSTLFLAFVTFTGYAIDKTHFQNGTAVLKEWLLLNAKLQFNATPFSITVDEAGNIKP